MSLVVLGIVATSIVGAVIAIVALVLAYAAMRR